MQHRSLARLVLCATALAVLAPSGRAENLNADYFNNLEQYQYKAQQQVQRDYRNVQKQVATAPAAAPLKGKKGKDDGYLWVGGKVGNRAFDDPDLVRSNNFAGGLATEPGGGDPDMLPDDRPGGGVLNLWMRF